MVQNVPKPLCIGECVLAVQLALNTDLHETRDTHDGLVGLVEHLPPGEDAARPGVLRLLGQEVGDVSHGPVGVGQLSVKESGGDVVLQQSLDYEIRI